MQDKDDTNLRELMKARSRQDPGQEFWDSYMARLQTRMAEEESPVHENRTLSGLIERLQGLLTPSPRMAWQVSFAVLMLFTGFLIGRSTTDVPQTQFADATDLYEIDAPLNSTSVGVPTDIDLSSLDQAYSVLSTSRTLLLGMVNFDPEQDDISLLSLDRRRTIATSLVQRTAVLSDELKRSDNLQMSQLLSDLEIILLEIANLDPDAVDIELIQSGVSRKSLLFKIDIAEMRRLDALNGRDADRDLSNPIL